MSTAREKIFSTLRRGLKRGQEDAASYDAAVARVNQRIGEPQRNLVPQRAQLPQPQQVELFIQKATALTVTVDRVAAPQDVPEAIANYLAQRNLPTTLRLAPHPDLQALPWADKPLLSIEAGPGRSRDLVSVTPAFAGIAETGTLMLHSGSQTATTLHFVPDNHIVVMRSSQITGSMEDAFAKLRQSIGGVQNWPRSVNLVTGPSRTADIEGVPVLGAHGPRQLHIVLIDDAAQEG